MKKLESAEQFEQLKQTGKHIFMFSAEWCGDCRFIDPFMPEIEEKFKAYTFIYVDRDEYIDICISSDVYGIPSFIAYHDGVEAGRFVSKDRKTQEEIEAFINSLQ